MKNFALLFDFRPFFVKNDENEGLLEVRIDLVPLRYWWDDAERDDLITHNLEVCVRCVESCELLLSTSNLTEVNTCSVDYCRHSHENVLILLVVHIAASWPVELSAAHSSLDHEN